MKASSFIAYAALQHGRALSIISLDARQQRKARDFACQLSNISFPNYDRGLFARIGATACEEVNLISFENFARGCGLSRLI